MRRLEKVLPNALPHRAIVHAAEVWRALNRWPEVVGEPLAARSWPDRFERGVAYVATSGSEWAQEMGLQKEVFLLRLRSLLGGRDLVRDLRFGVRSLPERPKPPPRPKRARREDSGEEIGEIIDRILSDSEP